MTDGVTNIAGRVCVGSKAPFWTTADDFRSSLTSRPFQGPLACLKGATSGLVRSDRPFQKGRSKHQLKAKNCAPRAGAGDDLQLDGGTLTSCSVARRVQARLPTRHRSLFSILHSHRGQSCKQVFDCFNGGSGCRLVISGGCSFFHAGIVQGKRRAGLAV